MNTIWHFSNPMNEAGIAQVGNEGLYPAIAQVRILLPLKQIADAALVPILR